MEEYQGTYRSDDEMDEDEDQYDEEDDGFEEDEDQYDEEDDGFEEDEEKPQVDPRLIRQHVTYSEYGKGFLVTPYKNYEHYGKKYFHYGFIITKWLYI